MPTEHTEQASSVASQPAAHVVAGRWPRYWARQLDLLIWCAICGAALMPIAPSLFVGDGSFDQLRALLVIPFGVALDAVIYAVFRNTPGKWLCGIKVLSATGQRISAWKYFDRNFRVYTFGLAFGIPIIALFTLINCYQRVSSGRLASWDEKLETKVTRTRHGHWRTIVVASAYLVALVCLEMLTAARPVTTPTHVSPAVNLPPQPASPSASDDALYPARRGALFGYVDSHGKFVIPPQFTTALPFDGDRALVRIGGTPDDELVDPEIVNAEGSDRIGYIDRTGKFVVPPRYKCGRPFGSGNWTVVAKQLTKPFGCEDFTFIDRTGKETSDQTYPSLFLRGGELAAAEQLVRNEMPHAGRVDCTGPNGTHVRFDTYAAYSAKRLASSNENLTCTVMPTFWQKRGYVNPQGVWVVPPNFFSDASLMSEHRAFVSRVSCDRSALIDDTGKLLTDFVFDECKQDTYHHFSEGLAVAVPESKDFTAALYGYVDTSGNFAIAPQFDSANEFSEGLARVEIGKLWGFVDHTGQFAINPSFTDATDFRGGRALACTADHKVVAIDTGGVVVTKLGTTTCALQWGYTNGVYTFVDYTKSVSKPCGFTPRTGCSLGIWTILSSTGAVIYRESSAPNSSTNSDAHTVSGSAFAVSARELLTNAHVVKGCMTVDLPERHTQARVAKLDSANDLALLHVESEHESWARIAKADDLALGADIVVFGYPLTGLVASTGNVTTGVVSGLAGLGDDSRYFQFSAPLQPGNSGGPVLNRYGEVTGMASATINQQAAVAQTGTLAQNVNFAIGPNLIRQFLSVNGIHLTEPTFWWRSKRDTETIATEAARFTSLVVCRPSN